MIEVLFVFLLVFVLFFSVGLLVRLRTLQARISKMEEMQERDYRILRAAIESLRKETSRAAGETPMQPPPLIEKPSTVPPETVPSGTTSQIHGNQPGEPPDAAALFDLEEKVGANWLLKLGMAMVVIGVALFLGYTFQRLGPPGKILIGLVVSAACLIGGTVMERKKDYVVFGRVILSGGWALAYLTAYGMRHIEATRILENDLAGLIALGIVSTGMILHSLRYSSEFFTGFAFGLAYLALMVSRVEWPGLAASVFLAISIVILVRLRLWFYLESFAIAATYLNHLIWLLPHLAIRDATGNFAEHNISFAMLIVYWVIFMVSHFTVPDQTAVTNDGARRTRKFTQFGMILNAVGFAALSLYQSFSDDRAFQLLLVLGLIYFGLALYSTRAKRREDFLTASTLGAFFLVIAFPYRFSGDSLSLLWLILIECFLLAGYSLHEKQFRRIAWITTIPFLFYHAFHQFTAYSTGSLTSDPARGLGLLTVAGVLLFNAFFIPTRFVSQTQTRDERFALGVYSYYGLITLLNFVRIEIASEWLGVGWAVIAMMLAPAGFKFKTAALQGILVAVFVVLWCLAEGLNPVARVPRMLAIASCFFAGSFLCRALRSGSHKGKIERYSEQFYFFCAIAVVTALLEAETSAGYLTAAWAIEGVIVFLSAILLDRRAYRLLGLGLLLICTGKILFVDVWHLETFQRIVTFIVLGISLVLISFLYTKYKESWRKIVLGEA